MFLEKQNLYALPSLKLIPVIFVKMLLACEERERERGKRWSVDREWGLHLIDGVFVQYCQAKVPNLDVTRRIEKDVSWLEITMNHSLQNEG